MKMIPALCATLAAGFAATAVRAEPWVDYTPQKGAYEYSLVKVQPNRVDDYLVALKKTWVPEQESLKRRGMIDGYWVQTRSFGDYGENSGPNVILIQHWTSLAALEPDRARDMEMMAEGRKVVPKEQERGLMEERGKYRTIIADELWTSVDLGK